MYAIQGRYLHVYLGGVRQLNIAITLAAVSQSGSKVELSATVDAGAAHAMRFEVDELRKSLPAPL